MISNSQVQIFQLHKFAFKTSRFQLQESTISISQIDDFNFSSSQFKLHQRMFLSDRLMYTYIIYSFIFSCVGVFHPSIHSFVHSSSHRLPFRSVVHSVIFIFIYFFYLRFKELTISWIAFIIIIITVYFFYCNLNMRNFNLRRAFVIYSNKFSK